MSKPFTRHYQECDFCHREYEVSEKGLPSISLPGYYTTSDGCKIPQRIVANICEECEGRICNHLAKVVDIKEIEWCKASIHWLDEKGEKDG